jgi:Leucine-rich repeat (LRR) protein
MNRLDIVISYAREAFFSCFLLFASSMSVWADIEINETTFPDESFRNWVLRQSYGQDGVLTDEEIEGVTSIDISYKAVQSLKGIEYFIALKELNCHYNQLTSLDVSKNTEMTTLYCCCNQLTSLDLLNNTAFENLECWQNQLTSLDVSQNIALTTLVCANNPLTKIDISNNTKLLFLSCQGNQLKAIDVTKNTELEKLNCKDNQLTELDVSKNKELKRLICSNNQLAKLELKNLTKLESLKCFQNRLERIIVSDCPKLWEIDCFNNHIKGEAIDELITGLSVIPEGWGHLCIVSIEDEQNVMTKSQVAAAREKGWRPRYKYGTFGEYGYPDYEGIDDPTGIVSPPGETEEGAIYDLQGRKLSGKPARGIYIESGKKVLVK